MAKKVVEALRSDPFRGVAVVAAVICLAMTPVALAKLGPMFAEEPGKAIALAAAAFAIATTPVAFAVLGRMDWFQARRGRVYQRPEFWSICAGMALIMGIPAILAAIVVKSDKFDKNRYEFDPNKTWSVLDQGRSFESVKQADDAVRREMDRLSEARKGLVDNVKKLDEAMLVLRAASGGSPAVAQAIPDVLQRLAGVRRAVGLDGPQQLMDFTAPPADIKGPALAANTVPAPAFGSTATPSPTDSFAAPPPTARPPAAAAPAGALAKAVADAELATVPEPQRALAALLPLVDVPAGWAVGKSGPKHIETFNAQNLFEKIDGRAESFIQYDVKGMAYAFYHPIGDEANEVQLYIFEMSSPLNALGKYGSEKPEEAKLVPVGTEGYAAAGSTLFHAGPFYTQIVSTRDDPKFAAFALDLAKQIAAKQKPEAAGPSGGKAVSTPEALFALLPAGQGRGAPKYVKEDVFGYSFLSRVFMAEYKEGEATWQGFLRPYATPDEAKAVFEKYVSTAKQDGAQVKTPTVEGADQFALASNIGLADVVFRKGNVIGGANGATDPAKAEAFARALLKALPASLPPIDSGPEPAKAAEGEKAPPGEGGAAEQ